MENRLNLNIIYWVNYIVIILTIFGTNKTTAIFTDVTTTEDFCAWESLNVTCSPSQVVVIHEASYGLMNVGKCIKRDYGAVGCKTDVTSFMDAKCSGRGSCYVPVISLHGKSHCNSDFGLYLEVTYGCVEASLSVETVCPQDGHMTVTKSSGQFASAVVSTPDSIGGPGCPIRIKVPSYQKINVTLIDFTVALSNDGWYPIPGGYRPLPISCKNGPGYIEEHNGTPSNRNITLCAGASVGGTSHMRARQSNVLISRGNVIDVTIVDSSIPFMIVYSALGCAPIEAPPNAVVQMKGKMAVVECNNTRAAWYLTCSGTQWVGSYSNCTTPSTVVGDDTQINDWGMNHFLSNMTTLPYGLLIVISLGVAIGVAIGVLMLLIVLAYLRRRKQRRVRSRSGYVLKAVESKYEEGLYHHGMLNNMAERSQTIGREDHYRCHPVGAECPHTESTTLQLRGVHTAPDLEHTMDSVLMTTLPNPPTMAPPPIPSEGHYSGSKCSSGDPESKPHKTLDYRWDSVSMNENEINELTLLRNHPSKSEPKRAFSISYGKKALGENKKTDKAPVTRRLDEPYYFKFDGVTHVKVDKEEQRPDVVSGCSACQYTTEQSSS